MQRQQNETYTNESVVCRMVRVGCPAFLWAVYPEKRMGS